MVGVTPFNLILKMFLIYIKEILKVVHFIGYRSFCETGEEGNIKYKNIVEHL
jgi:hypothetical protein